jgi:hypothetical protein
MTFDAAQRATFAALADVLVPAAEGMPAASAVDIAGTGLDRVLRARPDLEAPLARILAVGIVGEAMDRVRDVQRDDPAGFEALALAATGGYYTDSRVRDLIGYPGQTYDASRVREPDIDASDPMLRRVVERGPVYRPTPAARDTPTPSSAG